MKYLFASVLLLVMSPPTFAFQTAEECLNKMSDFDSFAKRQTPQVVPPGEEEAFKDYLKNTMNDVKMLCMKNDMDGAIRIVYKKACPQFVMCDKIKMLMDKGLSNSHKACIERVIAKFESSGAELKRQTYLRYPPEVWISMAAIGDQCWPPK